MNRLPAASHHFAAFVAVPKPATHSIRREASQHGPVGQQAPIGQHESAAFADTFAESQHDAFTVADTLLLALTSATGPATAREASQHGPVGQHDAFADTSHVVASLSWPVQHGSTVSVAGMVRQLLHPR